MNRKTKIPFSWPWYTDHTGPAIDLVHSTNMEKSHSLLFLQIHASVYRGQLRSAKLQITYHKKRISNHLAKFGDLLSILEKPLPHRKPPCVDVHLIRSQEDCDDYADIQ